MDEYEPVNFDTEEPTKKTLTHYLWDALLGLIGIFTFYAFIWEMFAM